MSTRRFKLTIAYRGTNYHGWQAQAYTDNYAGPVPPAGHGIPTVQETIARVLEPIVGHQVELVGSSRTDAGVHAKSQLAHFDTEHQQIPGAAIRRAANHQLPGDIFIHKCELVPDTFDAIRSVTSKRYQYAIYNAHERPVFANDLCWHRWRKLDADAMRQAATHFVGEHDFASFCRPGHGREHTIRTIVDCTVSASGPRVVIGVEGKGFLWNMVRIMVGTLVNVGVHQFQRDDIPKMFAARDRLVSGPTAPPHGLFLQWIRTKPADEAIDSPGSPSTVEAEESVSESFDPTEEAHSHPECDN
jgi:tRNA pseudouridine38-40 synthase